MIVSLPVSDAGAAVILMGMRLFAWPAQTAATMILRGSTLLFILTVLLQLDDHVCMMATSAATPAHPGRVHKQQ